MRRNKYTSGALLSLVLLLSQCQTTAEIGKNKTQVEAANNGENEMLDQTTGSEPDKDFLEIPVQHTVSGEYLRAFLVAYEAFKAEPLIPEEKKHIENYLIEFRQRGSHYFVLFAAKRKPNEGELEGGESALGKDVLYILTKTDYQITKRLFFK